MTEKPCLQCGKPFKIFRKPENRAAVIRYCDSCKARINEISSTQRQAMRTVTERPGGRGRTVYLSVN